MRLAAVAIASLLAACETITPDAAMSPRDLNENSAAFDGVEVSVQGMLLLGTNGRSLYQSEERFDQWLRELESGNVDFDAYTADCLTLVGSGAGSLVENSGLMRMRTVTLRGRFVANFYSDNVVDLQKCANQSALVVDENSAKRTIHNAGGSVK